MAGTRSALIVATYEYDDERLARLRAPQQDAAALAEVLADPSIGDFEVTSVVNRPAHEVLRALAGFFRNRGPDDLVLVHFSCHGLKDDSGELYFAAQDTSLDLLEATAVSSSSVNRAMDRSRAGRVLLLLDCCYSGAFARGMTTRAGGAVDVNDHLGGRGRAVITAATALQFAFEGDEMAGGDPASALPSVFTTALVDGLRTGEADLDLDGWVSLDELYSYIHDEVTRVNPDQTPTKWAFDIAGDMHVARRGRPVTRPAELPAPIAESMTSLFTWERSAVVDPLTDLLNGTHPGKAFAARLALQELAEQDDSDRVRTRAREALATVAVLEAPKTLTLPLPREPSEPMDEDRDAETPEERPLSDEPMLAGTEPALTSDGTPITRLASRLRAVSRGRWLMAAGVGVLLAAGVAWALTSGLGPDANEKSTDRGRAPRVPTGTMVVGQFTKGIFNLSAVDTTQDGATTPILANVRADRPTVSPDRKFIAYLSANGKPAGVIHLTTIDGAKPRMLLTGEAARQCPLALRPAWSPDGKSLALVCFKKDVSQGLWIFDVGKEAIRPVLAKPWVTGAPSWGGDGQIYFVNSGVTPEKIYSIAASGEGDPTPVTSGSGFDNNPDWSAAGLLYLRSQVHNGLGDIFLKGEGTKRPTRLSESGDRGSPGWSPDATSVVWITRQNESQDDIWIARVATPTTGATELTSPRHLEQFSGKTGAPAWGSR